MACPPPMDKRERYARIIFPEGWKTDADGYSIEQDGNMCFAALTKADDIIGLELEGNSAQSQPKSALPGAHTEAETSALIEKMQCAAPTLTLMVASFCGLRDRARDQAQRAHGGKGVLEDQAVEWQQRIDQLCEAQQLIREAVAIIATPSPASGQSQAPEEPSPSSTEPSDSGLTVADYEEVLTDHRRLVRELDVLLNGEAGAAKQASLCDIVAQVRAERLCLWRGPTPPAQTAAAVDYEQREYCHTCQEERLASSCDRRLCNIRRAT